MTDNDPWTEFHAPNSGDFAEPYKFDTLGNSIAGEIKAIRRVEFDGKAIPELTIASDELGERSVLCGQANLITQLLEIRPMVGDKIAIAYTSTRKAKLGTAKIFDVAVKRAGDTSADVPAVKVSKSAADLL